MGREGEGELAVRMDIVRELSTCDTIRLRNWTFAQTQRHFKQVEREDATGVSDNGNPNKRPVIQWSILGYKAGYSPFSCRDFLKTQKAALAFA